MNTHLHTSPVSDPGVPALLTNHKHVRDALVSFLKPESLKQYIGKMDEEVRNHLEMHWHGKEQVTLCYETLKPGVSIDEDPYIHHNLFSSIWNRKRIEKRETCRQFPVHGRRNKEYGRYRARAQKLLKDLIGEKRDDLKHGASPRQDLITYLLSIRDEKNGQVISEKEIIHNVKLIMVAGYDTSSALLTFLLRLFANNPAIYAAVLQGVYLTDLNFTRTRRDSKEQTRGASDMRGPCQDEMHMESCHGNSETVPTNLRWLPKSCKRFRVRWISHSKGLPEPSRFDPNSFENPASLPPYCFIPFGGGPRICPGYEFARIETLVSIHYLVTRFTWKILCSDNSFSRDPMLAPAKGLPVQISPRKLL
ncbi:hypothetical protein GQ457_13G002290 [Hibiscus cannabinus]